jgi:hypothetical protein
MDLYIEVVEERIELLELMQLLFDIFVERKIAESSIALVIFY